MRLCLHLLHLLHRRSRSSSLAACTTTGRFQDCGHGVPSAAWSGSAIPGSAGSCCWPAWSSHSQSTFINVTPARHSCIPLESIGRRSFPVAASTLWNTLRSEIQSSPSLTLFRQRLETYLFQKSFPDVLLWWLRLRGPHNNIILDLPRPVETASGVSFLFACVYVCWFLCYQ